MERRTAVLIPCRPMPCVLRRWGQQETGEIAMPKKILCATDGSKSSEKAIAYAVELARETGASLSVLLVNMVPTGRMSHSHYWDQNLVDAANAQIDAQLAPAAKTLRAAGMTKAECIIISGSNAADAIVAYADENKFDHIVVGSSIRNAMERMLVGSTATAVITRAHCPVTVAR
jgi:nucleotide-binding universal stress UspA family protein